ncbi:hypothetical protein CS063_15020 [Sporanaerobium hydrogeniformans]|uniref:Uncharacterized protein n=1 Tax=Sporanaerobium hydrogeniformans TaxID=3072179 RepID=A0AC61D7T3_9FIRM|nr:AAA family ATPase [Sporanaerobium hydrogeniformans]PHV69555.1 hypothetical protein CS063_15020 [Sporanaerobium hydrogeniformans]
MKIKRLEVKNFLGIKELNWSPKNGVNVLEGKKAQGKTSILEAIETAFTNLKRRSEVVRHGEEEATLYVETDTGIEIDRRIRTEKSDYLKVKGEGTASTEGFLRQFVAGNIFRPLDFVNMDIKEQTSIILNMIEIDWSVSDIIAWFGDEPDGINFEKHILQVLKDIEVKYYKEREEVNRQIHVLQVQCEAIKKELPGNYDGEAWREKNIQEYYNKISEAQNINALIDKAKVLKEGIENKVSAIKADAENQKSKVELKYRTEEQDIKDIIDLAKGKIKEANDFISNSDDALNAAYERVDLEMQREIQDIKEKYAKCKEMLKKDTEDILEEKKEIVSIQQSRIAAKESEVIGLADKKELELKAIDEQVAEKIKTEKARVGKAAEYLDEHEYIDIVPLQKEAEEVANMQSYLREWDRLQGIINGSLREKQNYSNELTEKIKVARTKPSDLLKTHELPLEGISVDEKGQIRINGTLLDGLSDGEKLEVAFKVALQRMGELRVMCLDGFEKLNPSEQAKVEKICEENDIQAFVTVTAEKELEVM